MDEEYSDDDDPNPNVFRLLGLFDFEIAKDNEEFSFF